MRILLPSRFRTLSASWILAMGSWACAAGPPAATTAAPDPDLPQPLDANTVAPLLTSSPFTRMLNLSERLVLTGVAYIDGKPVATIQDRVTKGSYLVSEQPNALGWKLASSTTTKDMKRTEVKILVSGETVTIRYGDQQLAPEVATKSAADRGPETFVRDGQTTIRSSHYMTDEQRERYHALPNDAREKWREIMRNNNSRLLAAPPEEREKFVKDTFEKFSSEHPTTK